MPERCEILYVDNGGTYRCRLDREHLGPHDWLAPPRQCSYCGSWFSPENFHTCAAMEVSDWWDA